jgi:O-acetylhomoserine/O-acetylserine sulfhydrylase-like pyridoxal-dependent enzyme
VVEGLTDAQLIERLQRLERNVAKLAAAAGVELDDPAAGIDPAIVELAQSGDRIRAAKLLSERTGTDFVEAQRVVNSL